MFANLFKRAEASVDNAIGDFFNRVVIALPLIVAFGFGAASLSLFVNRTYGPEIGNLIVAAAFVALGGFIAIVVKLRNPGAPLEEPEPSPGDEQAASASSMFDNEQLMGIVSSAAPILLPALLRTATKNWPLILAVAGGLYVFSLSGDTDAAPPPTPQT